MKRAVLGVFCWAFLAAAAVAQEAGGDTPPKKDDASNEKDVLFEDKNLGISYPKLKDYKPRPHHEFSKKELGYAVGYIADNGFKVDVYVYNLGKNKIPAGASSKDVTEAFDQSVAEIKRFYKDPPPKETANETTTVGDVETKHAAYEITYKDTALISHLYVGAMKDHYVKIRATYPTAEKAKGEAQLKEVLGKLGEAFKAAKS